MTEDPRNYPLTERASRGPIATAYPATKAYNFGPCTVMAGQENNGRWHMSIAHPSQLPTWEEIKEARKRTVPPEIFLCVPWPPRKYWFSLQDFCLHLWEIKDEFLIQQWKDEGDFARKYQDEIRRQMEG